MRAKFIRCRFFLIALFCCAASAQATPNPQDASKPQGNYESLVQRIKSGDQTVDFRQVRLAYMDSPAYNNGPDIEPSRKAMMAALNSKDFKGAIKNADVVLASDFVDMDAHFIEYIANRELKATDKANFHKFVLQSLLKSITDSGDGKTPETAYQVIQVHEEYVLLRFIGAELPESQSLLKKNGHSYDEIKFKDPKSGQLMIIYFNVDIPAKHGL